MLPAIFAANSVTQVGVSLTRFDYTPRLKSRSEAFTRVHCEPGAAAAARYICARQPSRLVGVPTDDTFTQGAAPDSVRFQSPCREPLGIATNLLRVEILSRVRVPSESSFNAKSPLDGMPMIPHFQRLCVPSIVFPPDFPYFHLLVMRGPLRTVVVRVEHLGGVDVS